MNSDIKYSHILSFPINHVGVKKCSLEPKFFIHLLTLKGRHPLLLKPMTFLLRQKLF